eukprot:COSAG02_NODE_10552_length_1915_cov_5.038546_2_plen_49_part_00
MGKSYGIVGQELNGRQLTTDCGLCTQVRSELRSHPAVQNIRRATVETA